MVDTIGNKRQERQQCTLTKAGEILEVELDGSNDERSRQNISFTAVSDVDVFKQMDVEIFGLDEF